MVKIEDKNGELTFTVGKNDTTNNKSGIIQISPEAMYALETIRTQTGLPITRIATALLLFAKDHYSVEIKAGQGGTASEEE